MTPAKRADAIAVRSASEVTVDHVTATADVAAPEAALAATRGVALAPADPVLFGPTVVPVATEAFSLAAEPTHRHVNACWWDFTQARWVCSGAHRG